MSNIQLQILKKVVLVRKNTAWYYTYIILVVIMMFGLGFSNEYMDLARHGVSGMWFFPGGSFILHLQILPPSSIHQFAPTIEWLCTSLSKDPFRDSSGSYQEIPCFPDASNGTFRITIPQELLKAAQFFALINFLYGFSML